MDVNGVECLWNKPTRTTDMSSACTDHVFARTADTDKTEVAISVPEAGMPDQKMPAGGKWAVWQVHVGGGQVNDCKIMPSSKQPQYCID